MKKATPCRTSEQRSFFIYLCQMRILRTIFLFLALSVILAHSVSPHHHHVEAELLADTEDDHHQHDVDHGRQHDEHSDEHDHGLFTYSQIENAFLSGKQVVVAVTVAPVLEIFEWSLASYTEQAADHFFVRDVELPPLLRCHRISFRGPPTLS